MKSIQFILHHEAAVSFNYEADELQKEPGLPISLNITLPILLNMNVTAGERRKQRWINSILGALSERQEEGLTVPQIANKLDDPSESSVRNILNNLLASDLVFHTEGKPWKWCRKDKSKKRREKQ